MTNSTSLKLCVACLLLIPISIQHAKAQTPKKLVSTLSIGGTSNKAYIDGNSYYYQQTVGQESIIGVNSGKQFSIRQGFIQPLKGITVRAKSSNELEMIIAPNPFNDNITLTFDNAISDVIIVRITNSHGQIVYNRTYSPTQKIDLNLSKLTQGLYVARVSSNGKQSTLKLIKN